MAQLTTMPPLNFDESELAAFGQTWIANGQRLSRTPPHSSIQLGTVFGAAVSRALATFLGGIPIVSLTTASSTPVRPNCVEVGLVRVEGGVRTQTFDVGYRPNGVRFVFDCKTLNDQGSVAKNWQNMVNDLAAEATTVHSRYPNAVVSFIVVLPAPAVNAAQREAIAHTLERISQRTRVEGAEHMAEATALVVWNPADGTIDQTFPAPSSPLRIERFSAQVEAAYISRYTSGERDMAFTAAVYRILIASPGDVIEERRVIPEVVYAWNASHAAAMRVVLLPVMWESHAAPEMGDRPQAIINKQIVADCDMLIGAFWTRIGSHTGVAESGTVEEIEQFLAAGKKVMLYFSSQPIAPGSIDPDQYRRLTEFKAKVRKEGLVEDYSSVAELREKLGRHLLRVVRELPRPLENASAPTTVMDSPRQRLAMVREQFAAQVRRYQAEWVAERDSAPINTREGRDILRRFEYQLLEFRTLLDGVAEESAIKLIDEMLKDSKAIQRHREYMDGGQSFRTLWEMGDAVFQKASEIVAALR
jgi:hypothetical protein